MSVVEMKKEIVNKINGLDESQLKMVERFIEKIGSIKSEWDLKMHINDILKEREEVLQKLAQ